MEVLWRIKAKYVTVVAGVLGLGTILLCYGLAVHYKHVPVWLPMISDCALKPPEKYPFRLGLVTTSLLVALEGLVIYLAAVPRSRAALGLSTAACLLLSVVGVVNSQEASKVHSGES